MPRIGRPPKYDLTTWTATGDWSERVPVSEVEIEVFGRWFAHVSGTDRRRLAGRA